MNAQLATISTLNANTIVISTMNSQVATTSTMNAQLATISTLNANTMVISTMNSQVATTSTMNSQIATTSTLNADAVSTSTMNLSTLNANTMVISTINAQIIQTSTMNLSSLTATGGITIDGLTKLNSNVSIGGAPLSNYALDVSGTIHASGDVLSLSDARMKTNIIQLGSALSTIHQLRGVSYLLADTSSSKIGLIAQEVEKVLPEVVITDTSAHHYKSVAYGNIVAVLIEGIKELSSTVEGMRSSKSFA